MLGVAHPSWTKYDYSSLEVSVVEHLVGWGNSFIPLASPQVCGFGSCGCLVINLVVVQLPVVQ